MQAKKNTIFFFAFINIKNNYYAFTYRITCIDRCRCYTLADKHLYSHGSQDQKRPQCGSSGRCYCMAAEGVWYPGIYERSAYIKNQLIILPGYLYGKIQKTFD